MLKGIKPLTQKDFKFKVKDLGDKYHIALKINGITVNAAYKSKQEWSNTTIEKVKESLVIDYRIRRSMAY